MNTSDTPARRSVYVRLHPRADHIQIHRTVEMLTTEDSEVQVDYGIGGEVRGVEILGALDVEIDGRAASAAPETSDPAVEARQLTDDADWEAIAAWSGGELRTARDISDEYHSSIVWPDGTTAGERDVIVLVRAALAAAATPEETRDVRP